MSCECHERRIAFLATTCPGCGSVYNFYNHMDGIRHATCRQYLKGLNMTDEEILEFRQKHKIELEKFKYAGLNNDPK